MNEFDEPGVAGGFFAGGSDSEEDPAHAANEVDHAFSAQPEYEPAPTVDAKSKPVEVKKKGLSGMSKMMKIILVTSGFLIFAGAFIMFDMQGQQQVAQPVPDPDSAPTDLAPPVNQPVAPMKPAVPTVDLQEPTAVSAVVASVDTTTGLESRLTATEARLDHIEAFLSGLAQAQEKQKPKGIKLSAKHAKKAHADKPVKVVQTAKPSEAIRPSGTVVDQQPGQRIAAAPAQKTTDRPITVKPDAEQDAEQVQPVVAAPKHTSCEYRGGLNNRAWVSCDDTLYSVKRGDILPQPYGSVISVNDTAGNVSTSGGLIQ